jgi:hypothetical protein
VPPEKDKVDRPLCLSIQGGQACTEFAKDHQGWQVCLSCKDKFDVAPISRLLADETNKMFVYLNTVSQTIQTNVLYTGATAAALFLFHKPTNPWLPNKFSATLFGSFESFYNVLKSSSFVEVRRDPVSSILSVKVNDVTMELCVRPEIDFATRATVISPLSLLLDMESMDAFFKEHELFESFDKASELKANLPRPLKFIQRKHDADAPSATTVSVPTTLSADVLTRIEESMGLEFHCKQIVQEISQSSDALLVLESLQMGTVTAEYALAKRPGLTVLVSMPSKKATAMVKIVRIPETSKAGTGSAMRGLAGAVAAVLKAGYSGSSILVYVDVLLSTGGGGAELLQAIERAAGHFVTPSTHKAFVVLEAMSEPLVKYYRKQKYEPVLEQTEYRFLYKDISSETFVAGVEVDCLIPTVASATAFGHRAKPPCFLKTQDLLKRAEEKYFKALDTVSTLEDAKMAAYFASLDLVQLKHAVLQTWSRTMTRMQFKDELKQLLKLSYINVRNRFRDAPEDPWTLNQYRLDHRYDSTEEESAWLHREKFLVVYNSIQFAYGQDSKN